MKQVVHVKDWHDIKIEYEAMASMSCVPVGIKKVPVGHIFGCYGQFE